MGIAEWLGIGKGVAEVTEKVTGGVANIITVAKGDLTPEAKGEIEKLKVTIAGDLEKIVQGSIQEAREFAIKYEGSAEQIPKWLLVVRSIIRPLITLMTFGWFMAILSIDLVNIAKRVEDYRMLLLDIPQGFWWILGVILTFWFGGKAVERITEKVRGQGE